MKYLSFILVLLSLVAGPAVRPPAALAEPPEDIGWVPLGPPGGDISHLLVHPRNPQILWAGTRFAVGPAGEVWTGDLGGICFSPDGLSGWTLLPGLTPYHNLFVLAADPHDPGTVFASTYTFDSSGYFYGLFRHKGD